MDPKSSIGETAKRCTLLQRRHDWSFQRFVEYWAGPHSAIAVTMPGIARYTQNRVSEPLWSRGQGFDCDGIVELEFRDKQSMAEAGDSDAARTLLAEDEKCFLAGITLCRVPRGARQVWPGMIKVMLAGCFAEGSQFDVLQDLLKASGCVDFSIDPVTATFHREQLAFEANPPDFFASLWFDPGSDLQTIFTDGSPWSSLAQRVLRRGSAWGSDCLSIVG